MMLDGWQEWCVECKCVAPKGLELLLEPSKAAVTPSSADTLPKDIDVQQSPATTQSMDDSDESPTPALHPCTILSGSGMDRP